MPTEDLFMEIISHAPIISLQKSVMRISHTASSRFKSTEDHLQDDSARKKITDCYPVKSGLEKSPSMAPFFFFNETAIDILINPTLMHFSILSLRRNGWWDQTAVF